MDINARYADILLIIRINAPEENALCADSRKKMGLKNMMKIKQLFCNHRYVWSEKPHYMQCGVIAYYAKCSKCGKVAGEKRIRGRGEKNE